MKLLIFADLHLDAPFSWMGATGRAAARRRQALCETLQQILQLARAENVDAILCGGDLYEQDRFSPDTANFLRSAFEQVQPTPVFIAPGNHDWYGPQSLYHTTDWSPNVHIFKSSRLEPVELDDGFTLWGGAHLAPAGTDNFLDGFAVGRSGTNIALFHASEMTALPFQEPEKQHDLLGTVKPPFDVVADRFSLQDHIKRRFPGFINSVKIDQFIKKFTIFF